jgi:hypothetical protein
MHFNDRCRNFAQLRDLILSARELAACDIEQPSSPQPKQRQASAMRATRKPHKRQSHAPAITDAKPLAVMAEPNCADAAKLEAAEARKHQLLAEIELERVARPAAGRILASVVPYLRLAAASSSPRQRRGHRRYRSVSRPAALSQRPPCSPRGSCRPPFAELADKGVEGGRK